MELQIFDLKLCKYFNLDLTYRVLMKMIVIMKILAMTTYLKVLYHQMVAEKLLIQVPISDSPGYLTTCTQ